MNEPGKLLDGALLPNLQPDEQWRRVQALLFDDTEERDRILEWLVERHKGYVDVRVQAGIELLSENPDCAWSSINKPIISSDPDDRDVALNLLTRLSSERAQILARSMLGDVWPYLRFDAAEYLKDIYPEETTRALKQLLDHQEEWVRTAAQVALDEMARKS